MYLISNGSSDFYPENKLTQFTNHLPVPIEFDSKTKWEVAVESFGLSCNFKRDKLNLTAPHIFIGTCSTDEKMCDETCGGERPVKFRLADASCWHKFYLTKNSKEIVQAETFRKLASEIYSKTKVVMTYSDNRLSFDLDNDGIMKKKSFWVALSKEFSDFYGLSGKFMKRQDFEESNSLTSTYDPYYFINFVNINGKRIRQRQAKFQDVEYNIYFLGYHSSAKRFIRLNSDVFILEKNYPKLVKIFCSEIEPQIFNNTFSKDLLVFSPDFQQTDDFIFKEVECLDFIPLINSTISDITIRLTDENNEQLNIETGHATIIKLRLKKMDPSKKSFNIRLSSEKSPIFPDNTNYRFKVKLPNTLDLEGPQNWRVCLNSISHPAKFATMLVDDQDRMIIFKEKDTSNVFKLIFESNMAYDEDKIYSELEFFLKNNGIGYLSNDANGRKSIHMTKPGKMVVSRFVGAMLGLGSEHDKHFVYSSASNEADARSWDASPRAPKIITPIRDVDISLLKPNYIMVYSDIVKSTIIAGDFAKILKIVPLKSTDLNYVIQEFKTKEFTGLERTQIDVIEVNLRSHDGAFINFLTNQDVVLNLEFVNYYD